MVIATLKQLTSGSRPVVVLLILLLTSFYLMSGATENSVTFNRIFSLLLGINILALILLVALILRHLGSLISTYRRREAGSRLTIRLVAMFVILSVTPVSVVYSFAIQFLNSGIDSWFDVQVERALEDSLELGRTSLDSRRRELFRQTLAIAEDLGTVDDTKMALAIDELREDTEAAEMTLQETNGNVIYSSSSNPSEIIPILPDDFILSQLRQGRNYTALEPIADRGLFFRMVIAIPNSNPNRQQRILHVIYPAGERLNELAASVQSAFSQYKELAFLREPLKVSFILTLSLILLLSLLSAVWAAFFSARRVVAPISDLVEGTREVAAGNYQKRLPNPGRDELGFLVRSFNEMTRKISLAYEEARRNREQVDQQRAYLETLLGSLSSGVLSFDTDGLLRTVNEATSDILGLDLACQLNKHLTQIAFRYPDLEELAETIATHMHDEDKSWQREITLLGRSGRQVLMCRGSSLPDSGPNLGGHVIVFDDVTALIQAQRDAAWGEVARRLAHEIKNPLTPIQLSAERLRRKYLTTLPEEDAKVLDRSTHTIVQQVKAMEEMVREFSDYARPLAIDRTPIDLNEVIEEVVELYQGNRNIALETQLELSLPTLMADSGRLRQLLHNLLKNAIESVDEEGPVAILITTAYLTTEQGAKQVEICIIDDGPGIPHEMLGRLFEPYITTKPRGTGLGLAIVRKIVEEHGGVILVENIAEGGARITLRIPYIPPRVAAQ